MEGEPQIPTINYCPPKFQMHGVTFHFFISKEKKIFFSLKFNSIHPQSEIIQSWKQSYSFRSKWSRLMVPFENRTFLVRFSNGKNRPPKCPVFECFRYSNVRFSDPDCILQFQSAGKSNFDLSYKGENKFKFLWKKTRHKNSLKWTISRGEFFWV